MASTIHTHKHITENTHTHTPSSIHSINITKRKINGHNTEWNARSMYACVWRGVREFLCVCDLCWCAASGRRWVMRERIYICMNTLHANTHTFTTRNRLIMPHKHTRKGQKGRSSIQMGGQIRNEIYAYNIACIDISSNLTSIRSRTRPAALGIAPWWRRSTRAPRPRLQQPQRPVADRPQCRPPAAAAVASLAAVR